MSYVSLARLSGQTDWLGDEFRAAIMPCANDGAAVLDFALVQVMTVRCARTVIGVAAFFAVAGVDRSRHRRRRMRGRKT